MSPAPGSELEAEAERRSEPFPPEGAVALDTNLLARLMLDDTPEQSALVRALLARLAPDRPALVGREVLAELAWVLSARGRSSRAAVAEALGGLLGAPELRVEAAADAREAVRR